MSILSIVLMDDTERIKNPRSKSAKSTESKDPKSSTSKEDQSSPSIKSASPSKNDEKESNPADNLSYSTTDSHPTESEFHITLYNTRERKNEFTATRDIPLMTVFKYFLRGELSRQPTATDLKEYVLIREDKPSTPLPLKKKISQCRLQDGEYLACKRRKRLLMYSEKSHGGCSSRGSPCSFHYI